MVFQRRIGLLVGAVVSKAVIVAAIGAGTSAVTSNAVAAIVYQQNFESPVTTTSSSATFGGFGQINNVGGSGWQIQGGGGGTGIAVTTGVDTNGVGGSQALFATWDHSQASGFTFNQFTTYGVSAPNRAAGANSSLDGSVYQRFGKREQSADDFAAAREQRDVWRAKIHADAWRTARTRTSCLRSIRRRRPESISIRRRRSIFRLITAPAVSASMPATRCGSITR